MTLTELKIYIENQIKSLFNFAIDLDSKSIETANGKVKHVLDNSCNRYIDGGGLI